MGQISLTQGNFHILEEKRKGDEEGYKVGKKRVQRGKEAKRKGNGNCHGKGR